MFKGSSFLTEMIRFTEDSWLYIKRIKTINPQISIIEYTIYVFSFFLCFTNEMEKSS